MYNQILREGSGGLAGRTLQDMTTAPGGKPSTPPSSISSQPTTRRPRSASQLATRLPSPGASRKQVNQVSSFARRLPFLCPGRGGDS